MPLFIAIFDAASLSMPLFAFVASHYFISFLLLHFFTPFRHFHFHVTPLISPPPCDGLAAAAAYASFLSGFLRHSALIRFHYWLSIFFSHADFSLRHCYFSIFIIIDTLPLRASAIAAPVSLSFISSIFSPLLIFSLFSPFRPFLLLAYHKG